MNPELVKAISQLAWPVIVAVVIWRLYPAIRAVADSRAFSVKVAGMEISVQQASEQLQSQIDDLRKSIAEIRDAAGQRPAAPAPAPGTRSRRILWVDDKPSNNAYAIAQLGGRGYEVLQATSTADALRMLGHSSPPVAAVISDMGREEGGTFKPEAGLELLAMMRKAGYPQPFLVCTTQGAAARYAQVVASAGGAGATNSMLEVFDFVQASARPA